LASTLCLVAPRASLGQPVSAPAAAAETPPPATAAEIPPPTDLDFALWLMGQEDWYRAVGQLKRHRFFAGPEVGDEVDALIGLCYLRGQQYFDAHRILSQVATREAAAARLRARASLLGLKAAHLGGASLAVVTHGPPAFEAWKATGAGPSIGYLVGHNLMHFGRWEDAAEAFSRVAAADSGPLGKDAARLAERLADAPRFAAKSPWLAGLLALVPGLGHVYAERYLDAWNALVPNAVLLPTTGLLAKAAWDDDLSWAWPGIVGALALTFYGANIYSAANVTRQANQLIVANEVALYRKGSQLERVLDPAADTADSVLEGPPIEGPGDTQ